jgi:hypothetical protein
LGVSLVPDSRQKDLGHLLHDRHELIDILVHILDSPDPSDRISDLNSRDDEWQGHEADRLFRYSPN